MRSIRMFYPNLQLIIHSCKVRTKWMKGKRNHNIKMFYLVGNNLFNFLLVRFTNSFKKARFFLFDSIQLSNVSYNVKLTFVYTVKPWTCYKTNTTVRRILSNSPAWVQTIFINPSFYFTEYHGIWRSKGRGRSRG